MRVYRIRNCTVHRNVKKPSPLWGEGAERSEADEGTISTAHLPPHQPAFGRQLPP